jgi:hypothetical protein
MSRKTTAVAPYRGHSQSRRPARVGRLGPTAPSSRVVRLFPIAILFAFLVAACGAGAPIGEKVSSSTTPSPLPTPVMETVPPPTQPAQTPAATRNPRNARSENPSRFGSAPGYRFDRIPPIYDPNFTNADDMALDGDELILGIEINGEAKAYPISVMRSREMVNDQLGGIPILATW